MLALDEIARILALAKSYQADRKRYARISERRMAGELSPKQCGKLEADLNWAAMDLAKIEKNLHVACVDAGLADLRDPRHYETQEFNPSAWHRYPWKCTTPKAMEE